MRHDGLHYDACFVTAPDRVEITRWLASIRPLWEDRFTEREARAAGGQRRLLRPVYWLGNWQFACLNYYRPPRGILDRCVIAEPYPPVLARLVARIEKKTRALFRAPDLPERWHLNTCLVNLYGSRIDEDGTRTDTARVGEHRDDEPGPVASISLGERALFQFVRTSKRHEPKRVVHSQWLDDRSLLIFGGHEWKRATVHRVLRVDRRSGTRFDVDVEGFETRRVNFTFRYVPDEHIVPYARLGEPARSDVRRYVEELARSSGFFAQQLAAAPPAAAVGEQAITKR